MPPSLTIIATVSPKTPRLDGADLIRLNGAFGTLKEKAQLRARFRRPILVDIPGPRLKHRTSRISDAGLVRWAARARVDFVALSYARGADEIVAVRGALGESGVRIIAKIETAEAAGPALAEILLAADGILIDRGDLAVSIGPEALRPAVDRILRFSRAHGRPAWVATGILASLQGAPCPTPRDVADVQHLMQAGATGLVLAEETAIGRFPREAVAVLRGLAAGAGESALVATAGSHVGRGKGRI